MKGKKEILGTRIFWCSLILSILLILTISHQSKLWSDLWILLMFIEIPLIGGFIAVLIWSIIWFLKKRKEFRKSIFPFLICSFTAIIVILVPLESSRIKLGHELNKKKKEEIVKLINEEKIKPNNSNSKDLIKLPLEYQNLSVGGGEIIVEKINELNCVLFYSFRGNPDGFSGFLYLPEELKIKEYKEHSKYKISRTEALNGNWFYVSGT